ncbi:uncharacterized protein LOC141587268 [Silene latifolia]|uniref:uncharacterized protein LOC141587268 n=1 Tax=Silene latifolia TaxID=37657 RepID=UPI003D77B651
MSSNWSENSSSPCSSGCSIGGRRTCYCGNPTAIATSWTTNNPGRRFQACATYNPVSKVRGCKFFQWIDLNPTNWQRDVANEILFQKNRLKSEVRMLNCEVQSLQEERKMMKMELDNLKSEVKKMDEKNGRNGRHGICKAVIVTAILLLVVWKLL